MDRVSPHQDKQLLKYIDKEMIRRDWIFRFQRFQSPITNVHDTPIFFPPPKRLRENKGQKTNITYWRENNCGRRLKSWDETPLELIVLVFSMYRQLVNAIYKHDRGNEHMHEKGALNFGSRRRCVVDEDGGGATHVPINNNLDAPYIRYELEQTSSYPD